MIILNGSLFNLGQWQTGSCQRDFGHACGSIASNEFGVRSPWSPVGSGLYDAGIHSSGIRSPDRPARSECHTDWAIPAHWETGSESFCLICSQKSAYKWPLHASPVSRRPVTAESRLLCWSSRCEWFGTGTGFSRSTSVFLVSVITKTPHTHIHSHTTLNQNLPTKVTVFGNKESSRQNNTLITFNLQNVNVASKRHSLDILHCLIEEKNTFRGKAMWDSSCAQNSGLGFIRLRWCGVPKPLSANSFCSSSET